MNILLAIKREEKKLEKQLHKLQGQLAGVRTAAKALGHSPSFSKPLVFLLPYFGIRRLKVQIQSPRPFLLEPIILQTHK
jgi:hypothetical protein